MRRGKTPKKVWICGNGHIDVLHYENPLDICSICGEVCEQRSAEVGSSVNGERVTGRSRISAGEVKVYRGLPFKPTSEVETTEATSFKPEPPTPAFGLDSKVRKQILEGVRPRITFPRDTPADHPKGEPYPPPPGGTVDLLKPFKFVGKDKKPVYQTKVAITILGYSAAEHNWVLHYSVVDNRTFQMGRSATQNPDYVEGDAGSIGTKQAPIKGDAPKEEQFRPEREPEPIAESAADRQAREDAETKAGRTQDAKNRITKAEKEIARDLKRGRPTTLAEDRLAKAWRALKEAKKSP